jgi:IS1 transposase
MALAREGSPQCPRLGARLWAPPRCRVSQAQSFIGTVWHHTLLYTGSWGTYTRHRDADAPQPGKRNTQQIERTHLTWRTRITRLVRTTLCFAKSISMHDMVIGVCVKRYAVGLQV